MYASCPSCASRNIHGACCGISSLLCCARFFARMTHSARCPLAEAEIYVSCSWHTPGPSLIGCRADTKHVMATAIVLAVLNKRGTAHASLPPHMSSSSAVFCHSERGEQHDRQLWQYGEHHSASKQNVNCIAAMGHVGADPPPLSKRKHKRRHTRMCQPPVPCSGVPPKPVTCMPDLSHQRQLSPRHFSAPA